jgi:hypothetical protein
MGRIKGGPRFIGQPTSGAAEALLSPSPMLRMPISLRGRMGPSSTSRLGSRTSMLAAAGEAVGVASAEGPEGMEQQMKECMRQAGWGERTAGCRCCWLVGPTRADRRKHTHTEAGTLKRKLAAERDSRHTSMQPNTAQLHAAPFWAPQAAGASRLAPWWTASQPAGKPAGWQASRQAARPAARQRGQRAGGRPTVTKTPHAGSMQKYTPVRRQYASVRRCMQAVRRQSAGSAPSASHTVACRTPRPKQDSAGEPLALLPDREPSVWGEAPLALPGRCCWSPDPMDSRAGENSCRAATDSTPGVHTAAAVPGGRHVCALAGARLGLGSCLRCPKFPVTLRVSDGMAGTSTLRVSDGVAGPRLARRGEARVGRLPGEVQHKSNTSPTPCSDQPRRREAGHPFRLPIAPCHCPLLV